MRQLSFLADSVLDDLLSRGLRIAARLGCGYDAFGNWLGPWTPRVVAELLYEYKERNRKGKR